MANLGACPGARSSRVGAWHLAPACWLPPSARAPVLPARSSGHTRPTSRSEAFQPLPPLSAPAAPGPYAGLTVKLSRWMADKGATSGRGGVGR